MLAKMNKPEQRTEQLAELADEMNSFIVQSTVAFNFNETNNRTSIDFLQFPK